jgi:hypothetical protein
MTLRFLALSLVLATACAGQNGGGETQTSADGRTAISADGIGWVGLFAPDMVGWLENQNQIEPLCAAFPRESTEWYKCRDTHLTPKVHVMRLRTAPAREASSAGDLIIGAIPGQGFHAAYVGPDGGAAAPVSPDLFDGDFGYGPYFHKTIVERRGSWIRLPEMPFPKGVWLDTSGLPVLWLEPGEIVESPLGDLYVIAVTGRTVRARHEQARDMWCEAGDPPPVGEFQEIRLGPAELFTEAGNLKLSIKYTRGC